METIKFGFIGAGKVGFSLGKYLKENNINVIGYYSRKLHSSQEAAFFTDTKHFENLNELVNNSDVIFITTPDSQIEQVYNELIQLNIKDKVICHCSGSISSTILSMFSTAFSTLVFGFSGVVCSFAILFNILSF